MNENKEKWATLVEKYQLELEKAWNMMKSTHTIKEMSKEESSEMSDISNDIRRELENLGSDTE